MVPSSRRPWAGVGRAVVHIPCSASHTYALNIPLVKRSRAGVRAPYLANAKLGCRVQLVGGSELFRDDIVSLRNSVPDFSVTGQIQIAAVLIQGDSFKGKEGAGRQRFLKKKWITVGQRTLANRDVSQSLTFFGLQNGVLANKNQQMAGESVVNPLAT